MGGSSLGIGIHIYSICWEQNFEDVYLIRRDKARPKRMVVYSVLVSSLCGRLPEGPGPMMAASCDSKNFAPTIVKTDSNVTFLGLYIELRERVEKEGNIINFKKSV